MMLDFYADLSPNLKASLIVIVALSILSIVIGRKVAKLNPKDTPKGLVFIAVLLVEMLNDFIKEFYGKRWKTFTPILVAVLLYLVFANTSALFGLANPLANITIALSFSLFAFLTIQLGGLYIRKPKNRIKDLATPNVLLMPLNVISEISTPLAMGLRLFGNLLSGSVMAVVVFNLLHILGDALGTVGAVLSTAGNISIAALFLHPIFNIGFGIVQAFVYFMLLTIFLSMAIEEPDMATDE